MFSLIITIISIALVAALALATIYYGGNSFNRGSADAKASQAINEGQQINGAFAMAKADAQTEGKAAPTLITDLVTGEYLAQAPSGWVEGTDGKSVELDVKNADVCTAVNKKAGLGDDTVTPVTATELATKVYGCITADQTVVYKF